MKRFQALVLLGVAAACFAAPAAAQSGTRSNSTRTSSPSGRLPEELPGPSASGVGIAVVELFTSQGCSSCPPADAALRQIASVAEKSQLPVYVLSFHVDYWNRLGWTDPYSSASHSQRQRSYASVSGSRRVYTPQMIVNGKAEFVGSNRAKAHEAISASLKRRASSIVQLNADADDSSRQISVQYAVKGASASQRLNIAVVETPAANRVPKGENAGRTLGHINVVRAFKTVPLNESSGRVELTLPDDSNISRATVIAYVQDTISLAVIGASSISVGP